MGNHRGGTRRVVAAILVAAASALLDAGCGDERPDAPGREAMTTPRPISEVLGENAERLMKIEGVVGVYEGRLDDGRECITVMVKSDRPGIRTAIPQVLEGYPVRLEIGGEIRPMR